MATNDIFYTKKKNKSVEEYLNQKDKLNIPTAKSININLAKTQSNQKYINPSRVISNAFSNADSIQNNLQSEFNKQLSLLKKQSNSSSSQAIYQPTDSELIKQKLEEQKAAINPDDHKSPVDKIAEFINGKVGAILQTTMDLAPIISPSNIAATVLKTTNDINEMEVKNPIDVIVKGARTMYQPILDLGIQTGKRIINAGIDTASIFDPTNSHIEKYKIPITENDFYVEATRAVMKAEALSSPLWGKLVGSDISNDIAKQTANSISTEVAKKTVDEAYNAAENAIKVPNLLKEPSKTISDLIKQFGEANQYKVFGMDYSLIPALLNASANTNEFGINPLKTLAEVSMFAVDMKGFSKFEEIQNGLKIVAETANSPIVKIAAKSGETILKTSNSLIPQYTAFTTITGKSIFKQPAKFVAAVGDLIGENVDNYIGAANKSADNLLTTTSIGSKTYLDDLARKVETSLPEQITKEINDIYSSTGKKLTQEESSYFDNLVNNIKATEDSTIKQQLKNDLINKISAETPDSISINILAKNNNDKASKIIAQRTAIAQKEYAKAIKPLIQIIDNTTQYLGEQKAIELKDKLINSADKLLSISDINSHKNIINEVGDVLRGIRTNIVTYPEQFAKTLVDTQPFNVANQLQQIFGLKTLEEIKQKYAGDLTSSNNVLIKDIQQLLSEGKIQYKLDEVALLKKGINFNNGEINQEVVNSIKNADELLFNEKINYSKEVLDQLGISVNVAIENPSVIARLRRSVSNLRNIQNKMASVPLASSRLIDKTLTTHNYTTVLKTLQELPVTKTITKYMDQIDVLYKTQGINEEIQKLYLFMLANEYSVMADKVAIANLLKDISIEKPISKNTLNKIYDSLIQNNNIGDALKARINIVKEDGTTALLQIKELLDIKDQSAISLEFQNLLKSVDKNNKGLVGNIFALHTKALDAMESIARQHIKTNFGKRVSYVPRIFKDRLAPNIGGEFTLSRQLGNFVLDTSVNPEVLELNVRKNLESHLEDVLGSSAVNISVDAPSNLAVKGHFDLIQNVTNNIGKDGFDLLAKKHELLINVQLTGDEKEYAINSIKQLEERLGIKIANVEIINGEKQIKILPYTDTRKALSIEAIAFDASEEYRTQVLNDLGNKNIEDISHLATTTPIDVYITKANKEVSAIDTLKSKYGEIDTYITSKTGNSQYFNRKIKDVVMSTEDITDDKSIKIFKEIIGADRKTIERISKESPETISEFTNRLKQIRKEIQDDIRALRQYDLDTSILDSVGDINNILGIKQYKIINNRKSYFLNGDKIYSYITDGLELNTLSRQDEMTRYLSDLSGIKTATEINKSLDKLESIDLSKIGKITPTDKQEIVAALNNQYLDKQLEKRGLSNSNRELITEVLDKSKNTRDTSMLVDFLKKKEISQDEAAVIWKMIEETDQELAQNTILKQAFDTSVKTKKSDYIWETLRLAKAVIAIFRWGVRPVVSPLSTQLSWYWAVFDTLLRDGFEFGNLSQNSRLAAWVTFDKGKINSLLKATERVPAEELSNGAKFAGWLIDVKNKGTDKFINGLSNLLGAKNDVIKDDIIIKIARKSQFGLDALYDGHFHSFAGLDNNFNAGVLTHLTDKAVGVTESLRKKDFAGFVALNNYTNNLSLISNARSVYKEALATGIKDENQLIEIAAQLLDNKFKNFQQHATNIEKTLGTLAINTYAWQRTQLLSTLYDLTKNPQYQRNVILYAQALKNRQDKDTDTKYGITNKYGPFWFGTFDPQGGSNLYTMGANPVSDLINTFSLIVHGSGTTSSEELRGVVAREAELITGLTGWDVRRWRAIDPNEPGNSSTEISELGFLKATPRVQKLIESLPKWATESWVTRRHDLNTNQDYYETNPYINYYLDKEPTGLLNLFANITGVYNSKDQKQIDKYNLDEYYKMNFIIPQNVMKEVSNEIVNEKTQADYQKLDIASRNIILSGYAKASNSLYMTPPQKMVTGAKISKNELAKYIESKDYPSYSEYTKAKKEEASQ